MSFYRVLAPSERSRFLFGPGVPPSLHSGLVLVRLRRTLGIGQTPVYVFGVFRRRHSATFPDLQLRRDEEQQAVGGKQPTLPLAPNRPTHLEHSRK